MREWRPEAAEAREPRIKQTRDSINIVLVSANNKYKVIYWSEKAFVAEMPARGPRKTRSQLFRAVRTTSSAASANRNQPK